MNFGTRIREMRNNKGISLRKASEEIGISYSYLSELENNKKKPSSEIINKISDYYQTSADYILCRSDLRSNPSERIKEALESDPELLSFWEDIEGRSSLKLLFKQTRDLPDEAIQDVINIIKRIEGK